MVEGTFPDDYMHYDEQGLLDHYTSIGQDIRAAYELGDDVALPDEKAEIDQIIVLGMGGSALSGEVLKLYLKRLGAKIPVVVSQSYSVPESLTEHSLVFTISYSGNTEETVSAYRQAIRTAKHVIALSKGGKLEEITNLNRKPFLKVPKGFQPRTAALTYLFFPLLRILERYRLLPSQQGGIDQLVKGLAKPDFKSLAISISEKLEGKIPLIYTSGEYYPVAYRFKTQLNECAKIHAFSNSFSELNHNEMLGFTDLKADFHIVLFNFDDDHRRIKKRMGLTREITAKHDVETTEVKMSGDHLLTKLYSAMIIGDLTSFYLALRYGRDPSPVELIEQFKERLGPFI